MELNCSYEEYKFFEGIFVKLRDNFVFTEETEAVKNRYRKILSISIGDYPQIFVNGPWKGR